MRRREFIALFGCAAVLRSYAVAAQEPSPQARRIVVLEIKGPQTASHFKTFEEALRALGWARGANLYIDYRVVDADREMMRAAASEAVASAPELVVTQSTPMTLELLRVTHSIPLVFVHVSDPIGDGIVAKFARPGGNATGFTDTEASLAGKWLQLLKEVAPSVTRAGLLFNPGTAPGHGELFLDPFTAAGASFGISTTPVPVRDVNGIETALGSLAGAGGGLVVAAESFTASHSSEIVALVARFGLPAVYSGSLFARSGGLVSYGIDSLDLYRRAASYVDRILKGASPADLPVQQPTKFELLINLKTTKALGLTVPPSMLDLADEVIE